jgi:hypothetical protein
MGIIKNAISGLFSKGASELADTAFKGLDGLLTSKEEKGEIQIRLEEVRGVLDKNKMDFQLASRRIQFEISEQEYKDRADARDMYMKDSSLQKVFAVVFLVFYCLISMGMIAMIISMAFFGKTVDLPDWGVMLITSVFTGMSVKVNTIVDFLFGGSKGKDDSDKRVAEAFKDSQK